MAVRGSTYPPRPNSLSTGKRGAGDQTGHTQASARPLPPKAPHRPPWAGSDPLGRALDPPGPAFSRSRRAPPGGPPPDQPPRSFLHEEAVVLFLLHSSHIAS